MEFARDSEDRLHVVRPDAKYWTLCREVVSVRNRWHGNAEDLRLRTHVCETCAREALVPA